MPSEFLWRTFQSLQQILGYIPADSLKVRKLEEVWSLQTSLHLITPNMRSELVWLVKKTLQLHKLNIKTFQTPSWFLSSWHTKESLQPNEHAYLSCMPMLRLWRKFPPKAIQSWEVRTAWIHPVREVKNKSTVDRHMPTNKHLVYTDSESHSDL